MYATLQLLISSIFFFSRYFIVTLLIKDSGKAKKRLILEVRSFEIWILERVLIIIIGVIFYEIL